MENKVVASQRIFCIDWVRGLDMFLLTVIGPLAWAFFKADPNVPKWIQNQFDHVTWEGFVLWDIIMPLFLFITGAAMPFALAKYKTPREVGWRVAKRFVILWLLGLVAQGNLLALDPHRIYLYTNTLQTIAVGYLFSVLPVLKWKWRGHVALVAALLIAFWALMQFVTFHGFGGGDWTAERNLAEGVDRWVLGRFRDQATVDATGQVIFAPFYTYTWIVSSLGFIATVMTGVLAGDMLRSALSGTRKALLLFAAGIGCAAAGWLLDFAGWIPVIKHIWSPSMVLVSSGYCYLLLGFCYVVGDLWGKRRGTGIFILFGGDALLVYMLSELFSFQPIAKQLLFGIGRYLPPHYPSFLYTIGHVGILILILWVCRRLHWQLKA